LDIEIEKPDGLTLLNAVTRPSNRQTR